ncbi:MAG: ABC transporter substrate-binding protein [Dehalococcoidia bacterium]
MGYQRLRNPKTIVSALLLLTLLFVVACGSAAPAPPEAAPATAPQAAATTAPQAAAPLAGGSSTSPQVAAPTSVPAAASAPATTGEAVGTLRIAYTELGPPRFIPKFMGSPQSEINVTVVWESPWHMSPQNELLPRLFEEWSVSPDGLVWTMKVREGIQFHKGKGELTAADIVFSGDNRLEEGTISRPASLKAVWQAPEGGVSIIDDYTVEIDTTGNGQRFDISWAFATGKRGGFPVVSKNHVEALGQERAQVEEPIGTGPWENVEHKASESWRMDAVKDHWRKVPEFSELIILEIAEEATRVANFQAGKLDSMHMSLESIPVLEQMPGVKFKRLTWGGQMFINIHGQMYVDREDLPTPRNSSLPWISSNPDTSSPEWEQARKVREAMAISIDRQLIVDTLLKGEGSPSSIFGWMGNEHRLGPLYEELVFEYNPERAKQLLAEAGYPDGIDIDMALTTRPLPAVVEQGEVVCLMWEEVGIRCTQTRSPMSAFRPNFIKRSWEGVNTHGTDYLPEPLANTSGTNRVQGTVNYGIEHPWLEEKIALAEATFDEEERFKVQAEIAQWQFHNVTTLPTFLVNRVFPLGPEIDDWEMVCCRTQVLMDLEHIPHRR